MDADPDIKKPTNLTTVKNEFAQIAATTALVDPLAIDSS